MNTNALKKFAQNARRKLLDQVGARMDFVLSTDSAELREKASQVRKLREEINATSKDQVIDKVAYTWFNRLMALRFMDVNDYQPLGLRVVTPKDGFSIPEILNEAKQGHIDEELPVKSQHIYDLLDGRVPSTNPQNEAYKELLIGACNHLSKILPFLFERISDYSELLLPEDLTSEFSIVQDMRDGMNIEDCQEVEIIGWLYQYYISEKKDEVFASKSKVKAEDIPAATQLFTPRWIVEYMVQNTLGKLWLQNKPESRLRDHMPYFIESESGNDADYLKVNSVEEIKLLDQASGSGHILVYAFDLFSKIYEEEGYSSSEIPQLIIEKNLFGFEIDERAAQLAGFALLMKARSHHRRVFRTEINPNILCFENLKLSDLELSECINHLEIEISDQLENDLQNLKQATNLGSLIKPHASKSEITVLRKKISQKPTSDAFLEYNLNHLKTCSYQLDLLADCYDCIVDNPPYMGSGNMNKSLSEYVKINYSRSKADLMTCFMDAGMNLLKPFGFLGMINLPAWMFLSSFNQFRSEFISTNTIDSFLHLGRGIFGSDFGSVAFIIEKSKFPKRKSTFYKLFNKHVEVRTPKQIESIFLDRRGAIFKIDQKEFTKLPNAPLAYWATEQIIKIFEESKQNIDDIAKPRQGLATADNDQFTRQWYEVDFANIGYGLSKELATESDYKWFPYNKGGEFRKWYGNQNLVVNWWKDGHDIKADKLKKLEQGLCLPSNSKPKNMDWYFKESISWSKVTAGGLSLRYYEMGFVFDVAGCSIFSDKRTLLFLLGLLNSSLKDPLISSLSPTVNYEVGTIKSLPIVPNALDRSDEVIPLVSEIVNITKGEAESHETSYSFGQNELVRIKGDDLEEAVDLFQQYWRNKFLKVHKNENLLNEIYLKIYGLDSSRNIEIAEITLLKDIAEIKNGGLKFKVTEILKEFISYSIGCAFGRYSLEASGVVFGNLSQERSSLLKDNNEMIQSFTPDKENIIPVLEDEWFEDDIVGRFSEFLRITFGQANFEKNLAYIEDILGKSVRDYFAKDFYTDHIKRYQKRPIYWMFGTLSGSFSVLIYMHRYTPDLLNNILNDYLREYQEKLQTRIEYLDHLIETGSGSEQTKAAKKKDKLNLVLIELQEYERDVLYPLATERIEIDLDDGVLVNYNKFGKAIKEVKGLNDKKTKDKVRKFDWIDTSEIR